MFKTSKRLVAMLICLAMVLSMVPAVFAADAAGTTLYMTPSSNWLTDSPWFAAYFFGDSGNTWVAMEDSDNDGTYEVVVPEGGYTKVIFCRMNPSSVGTLDWSAKWNQTGDLSIPSDDNVLYVVSGWDGGAWTTLGGTVEADTNYYLRGSMNGWVADEATKMTDNGDGTWTITLALVAGSYSYKAAYSDWSVSYGDPNSGDADGNALLTMTNDADVTFTLDTNAGTLTNDYVASCTHANVTELAAVAATCTTAGKTAGSVCADCGATVVAQEEIAALGHTYGDDTTCDTCGLVVEMITVYFENNWMFQSLTGYYWGSSYGTNPEWPGVEMEVYTTTEAGYIVYALTIPSDVAGLLFKGLDNDNGSDRQTPDITNPVDGTVYYMNWNADLNAEEVLSYDVSNLTPACEHTNTTVVAGKDATCTETGLTEGSVCADCGETQVAQEEIAATGHAYFYPCDAYCMNCYELTNEAAAHTIVHVDAVEATCQATGNIEYWYCSDCGSCWADEALTMVTNRMSVVTFVDHEYFYPCDTYCMNCYEETNPDATHNVVHVEASAGDCQTIGNVEYWYCSDCGTAWLDEAQTQWTNMMSVRTGYGDHNYVDGVCSICGDNTNDVKWQVTGGTTAESTSTNLRLITWVDSLDYSSVTFNVTINGTVYTYECDTAYTAILADGSKIENPDVVFGNESAVYFITYSLTGVPADAFYGDISVSVTWTSLEGDSTTCASRTFAISDYFA